MPHTTKQPTVYLAGAIRDGHNEDIEWREYVLAKLVGRATFLNPLASKHWDPATGHWTMSGVESTSRAIYKHDLYCVRQSDIILANLTSLSDGYPTIGTLTEVGYASAFPDKLIYTILGDDYTGHGNHRQYQLHPFLEQVAAYQFSTTHDAVNFLGQHLLSLSGTEPHYRP